MQSYCWYEMFPHDKTSRLLLLVTICVLKGSAHQLAGAAEAEQPADKAVSKGAAVLYRFNRNLLALLVLQLLAPCDQEHTFCVM